MCIFIKPIKFLLIWWKFTWPSIYFFNLIRFIICHIQFIIFFIYNNWCFIFINHKRYWYSLRWTGCPFNATNNGIDTKRPVYMRIRWCWLINTWIVPADQLILFESVIKLYLKVIMKLKPIRVVLNKTLKNCICFIFIFFYIRFFFSFSICVGYVFSIFLFHWRSNINYVWINWYY